jgi:hypothetical protein
MSDEEDQTGLSEISSLVFGSVGASNQYESIETVRSLRAMTRDTNDQD